MHYFLNVAEANKQSNGFIYCPCSSCKNMKDYSTSKNIHVHLLENGFIPSYNCWTKHGERGVILEDNEEEEDSDNYPIFTEDSDSRMGGDEAEEEPIFDEPIFDDPNDDLGRAILDAKMNCGNKNERLKLEKMRGSQQTVAPKLRKWPEKAGYHAGIAAMEGRVGSSDKGFQKLLKIIKKMLPWENVLPSSMYEAKKVVCPLGLEVQKIRACINDCILYRKEYKNLNACPVCSALRYKIRRDDPGDVEGESNPRKRVPAKVMWPEGSISKGCGTEEVIEFCVDFNPDLKPIGVPESRYEGRLRGKGTLGKKAKTCMDGHSFTQAHYTVLHNSILVAPYKEEHKDILRSKYPEQREDWIDGEHMKTFGGWLQTHLMNVTDDEQLYLLAKQPSPTISTFQGYEINGNTFYMFAQDKKSTNQNSGVRFDAEDDNGNKVTYYGYIEEIWELDYVPNFKVPLFRCKWFNLKDGVEVDPQYGMTTVDLKNLGNDTEPFGLASEVAQVFDVKDMSSKPKKRKERQEDTSYDEPKRHIVLSGKINIVGVEDKTDMSEDYNKFDDIPPFKSKLLQIYVVEMASPINFNQFLEKEKLKSNGSNFTDWFRHVRIFLSGGNLQFVLDAPLGDPPAETETDEVKAVYETRKTRYSQVQCALLCSPEADLQKRFEHHDPHELVNELKAIFETHAAVECYEASKHFFSCMMEEGSSVSEHMLAMTGHAKKLSDLGIVIPNRLGINRVLQSPPPSYKNFVMNYNMQNMNKELPELFGMLKAAEIEIKKEHQVLMVNKTTSFKKQGKSKENSRRVARKLPRSYET
ncbi:hypothetical protein QYE76_007448 [Lolium multiflorum]|uniref:Transposon protein, putative, CACTA, En/Spm sub-class n=1 Tax=Lolium multiflorum TaxID=4521 RepID=A0AAD8RWT9_LOLMU|nr:hypothetical protein QYE76_007448 [Lolium multiflorum]